MTRKLDWDGVSKNPKYLTDFCRLQNERSLSAHQGSCRTPGKTVTAHRGWRRFKPCARPGRKMHLQVKCQRFPHRHRGA